MTKETARILRLLETTEHWVMASTVGRQAHMRATKARRLLDELVMSGEVVVTTGKKGAKYALTRRQHEVRHFSGDPTKLKPYLQVAIQTNRAERAEVAAGVLARYQRWVSVKTLRDESSMCDRSARDAMMDLVEAGRAVRRDVVIGTVRATGAPLVVGYYATPEAALLLADVDIARERVTRPAPVVHKPVEMPMMRPKAVTSTLLTKAQNALTGAQMERLKELAIIVKSGQELTTAIIGECLHVGACVKDITYAPLAAVDLAAEIRDRAMAAQQARRDGL